jgi:hypothetical protein
LLNLKLLWDVKDNDKELKQPNKKINTKVGKLLSKNIFSKLSKITLGVYISKIYKITRRNLSIIYKVLKNEFSYVSNKLIKKTQTEMKQLKF